MESGSCEVQWQRNFLGKCPNLAPNTRQQITHLIERMPRSGVGAGKVQKEGYGGWTEVWCEGQGIDQCWDWSL